VASEKMLYMTTDTSHSKNVRRDIAVTACPGLTCRSAEAFSSLPEAFLEPVF